MGSDFFAVQDLMVRLDNQLDRVGPSPRATLLRALDVSWIFHDFAIDGDILDADEILAAIEGRPTVEGSTQQMSDRIVAAKTGLDTLRREVRTGESTLGMGLLKSIHTCLTPDEPARQGRYRQLPAVHRTYYHEIAKPSRISYLLRRLFAWLDSDEARGQHPIAVAAELQQRLLFAYPFEEQAGRACRLLSMGYLFHHGYVPIIIHAQDRQRYYKVFVEPDSRGLAELIAESLENTIRSSLRFLEQRSGTAALNQVA